MRGVSLCVGVDLTRSAQLVLVCVVSLAVLMLRVYMLTKVSIFAIQATLPVPAAPQYVATGLNAALNAVVIIMYEPRRLAVWCRTDMCRPV
jgi:hypothetical protein